MKKFVLAVFLAVLALVSVIAIYPSHASTATTMSIDSSTQQFPSATVGSTIQINIEVSNVQGLWAWDVAGLTFNPAYLNLTGASEGPFLQKAGQTLFIWTSTSQVSFAKGVIPDISDALLSYSTESGSGVLVTLTFQVLSLGTSQVAFNQTTLDTPINEATGGHTDFEQIPCTNINANIVLGPNTATPSPTFTSNPSSTPVSSTSPKSSTTPTASSTAKASSSPNLTSTPTQNAPEYPIVSILIVLFAVITLSTLVLATKAKVNKK